MKDNDYISEFEELIKLKEFSKKQEFKIPYDCTWELISKALENEYFENINDKIKRWVDVTHVMYFEEVRSVKYYFQSKMLYRDGFYESSIALSRSISEMVCYDLIEKYEHPFGDIENSDAPMFRLLLNFLAIPKKVPKNHFENEIVNKIAAIDDCNFMKSSYQLDKAENLYIFRIECGQKNKNLEKYLEIFKTINFHNIDNLKFETYQNLHKLYDIGNDYIHAKVISSIPKNDAKLCLNILANVLSELYGLKTDIVGKTIKSGYMDFPDICKGMNFAISYATTPDEVQRIYYNRPSQAQIENLLQVVGTWEGEWKDDEGNSRKGILNFYIENNDHLCAILKYSNKNRTIKEPMEIRLFGDYFHLIGFDQKDMKHKKNKHIYFEMELLDSNIITGKSVESEGKLLFRKVAF